MKSDVEISQETVMEPITKIAGKLGISEDQMNNTGITRPKSTLIQRLKSQTES